MMGGLAKIEAITVFQEPGEPDFLNVKRTACRSVIAVPNLA